jgi:hypothetical protein
VGLNGLINEIITLYNIYIYIYKLGVLDNPMEMLEISKAVRW